MEQARSSPRCFDRYVMIDWSAQSSPKQGKDSIWIAVADCDGQVEEVHNPSTRHGATELLVELLSDLSERVLVGCDFSFGYPSGLQMRSLVNQQAVGTMCGRGWVHGCLMPLITETIDSTLRPR